MSANNIVARSGDARTAATRLIVDLTALVSNYRLLAQKSGTARTAAVVKANGYGLGAEQIAPALAAAGCMHFFVANSEEGASLRNVLAEAEIFVLGGCASEGECAIMAEARLIPVLQSRDAIGLWAGFWAVRSSRRPCAIMVDTGMNRLGLTPEEAASFARENAEQHIVTPILVMSHLACADEPAHPLNRQQLESFQQVHEAFQDVDSSLANSAGIFLGAGYHFDMTRPGVSLYGGAPATDVANPMQPVATFEARILQIRHAKKGETVSYGAAQTLKRDTLLAVAGVGYADGYHRTFSGSGIPLRDHDAAGGYGFLHSARVPVVGRVTMDQTVFDVTDLKPETVKAGDWIELFGANIPVDEAARMAGTVSYEILTSCARRASRRYVKLEDIS